MTEVNGINLNSKLFTFEWIWENHANLPSNKFTQNELKTLAFCGQWLSGQKQFSVQTSGSTGQPKSVTLTRQQMTASARMTGEALSLNKGDHALACLSVDHIAGLMMLVRSLELELNLTIVEPAGDPFASLLPNIDPFDFTALVPLQLQTVLNSVQTHLAVLNKMKAILVGGAPISIALEKAIQKVRAPIYQTFGMTETVSHIALRRLNGPDNSKSYEALPGVEIGQDDRGCLTVMSAVTNNRRLVTNDLVGLQSKSRFVWLGRIDNVINSGGVKVCAEKVERTLAEILRAEPGEFFVCGLPDANLGEIVTVVFEGNEFSKDRQNEIHGLLSQRLGKYEIPRRFEFLPALLRTATGKIDRRANLQKVKEKN